MKTKMKITTQFYSFKKLILLLIFLWMILFALAPNIFVIVVSFLEPSRDSFFYLKPTLANYENLLDVLYLKVFLHSLFMASIATLLCLLIAYPFAYFISQQKKSVQSILLILVIIPFWTNSLIRTYAIKGILGTNGLLNKLLMFIGIIDHPLRLLYTELAVIIGFVYVLLPFMILPLYAGFEKLDKTLFEAAKDLGANSFQRVTKILIPLTIPSIIGGILLVFLPALGMFYISDLLGGAKNILIGNIIKNQILYIQNWPFGAAISIALTLIMAIFIYFYHKFSKRNNDKVNGINL